MFLWSGFNAKSAVDWFVAFGTAFDAVVGAERVGGVMGAIGAMGYSAHL